MKSTHLSLCFILLSISYTTSSSSPVLDITGDELRAGVDYHILPVIRGRGGGLTLATTGNQTCPLHVAQEQLEVENGLPLTFKPVNTNERVIHLSTDQNIKFSANSICAQSTVWKLDFDGSMGRYFVATGGVTGQPGPDTISNWFKVDEYGGYYKLVFCPSVCENCRVVCGDIGVFVQDGKRRLGLNLIEDLPFMVMFKKA